MRKISPENPKEMTEDEYKEHQEGYDGICLNCASFRYGDTEPDAEEYHCEFCESDEVQGIENALISGNIEIV